MISNRPKAQAIVQIDNERVIITQWVFSPGAETGWHKHGYDYKGLLDQLSILGKVQY